ncbi:MAG TPA: PilN domain-containing protein [Stenomitos sp.]
MYRIDINFLNDRPEFASGTPSQGTIAGDDKTPLIWGGAVAGGLVGLVLLLLGGLSFYSQQLASRDQALKADLEKLAPGLKQVEELQKQETTIQAQTTALATIFNQIKPWSATLQDLRDRVPSSLRVTKIEQIAPPPPPAGQAPPPSPNPSASPNATPSPGATPSAAPPPPSNSDLKISGNALSFSDINDFELILRKSPFLKSDATKLVSSQRQSKTDTEVSLVDYEMQTQLSDVPASELLQVLNAKGAAGLVSRIEVLKRQGVMKP